MNQQDTTCASQETHETQEAGDGQIVGELEAEGLLRSLFGIPQQAMGWVLSRSPYAPGVARWRECEGMKMLGIDRVADGRRHDDVLAAGRTFMSECKRDTPSLWSHRKVAGRFRLRPPADQVFAASNPAESPREGRQVPRVNLSRIAPDDLADFKGFAGDWAAGRLNDPSLGQDAIVNLAFVHYGLSRSAVLSILHFGDDKPEPVEWVRPPRPRAPLLGVRWRAGCSSSRGASPKGGSSGRTLTCERSSS